MQLALKLTENRRADTVQHIENRRADTVQHTENGQADKMYATYSYSATYGEQTGWT